MIKRFTLLLLLILPVVVRAQTPITPSWTRQTTQTGIQDSIRLTYSGQITPQWWWSSAKIRNWVNNSPHTFTGNLTFNGGVNIRTTGTSGGLRVTDTVTGDNTFVVGTAFGNTNINFQTFGSGYQRLTYQGNLDIKRNSDDATINFNGLIITRNSDGKKVLFEGDAPAVSAAVKNSNTGTSQDSVGHGSQMGTQFKADQTISGATQFINNKGSTFIVNTYSGAGGGSDTSLNRNNVLTIWRHSTQPLQPSAINFLDSLGRERGALGWAQVPFGSFTSSSYSQAYGNAMFFTTSDPYHTGFTSSHGFPGRMTFVVEGKMPDNSYQVGALLSLEQNRNIRLWTGYRDSTATWNGVTGILTHYKRADFLDTVSTTKAFKSTGLLLNLPSSAAGDMYYRAATGYTQRLAIGGGNTILVGGTTPSWNNGSGLFIQNSAAGQTGTFNIGTGTGALGILQLSYSQNAPLSNGFSSIYSTLSTGASYPYNASGHTVIQLRQTAARDLIVEGGTTPSPEFILYGATGNASFGGGTAGTDANYRLDLGAGSAGSIRASGTIQLNSLTASKPVFTDGSKNLTSTGPGSTSQYIDGTGALQTMPTKTAVVRSSASTLTLAYGTDYVFTGTTTTYTLPAVSGSNATRADFITIKNAGSGNITLNSNTGSTIYDTSLVSTITIAPGSSVTLVPDATQFNRE